MITPAPDSSTVDTVGRETPAANDPSPTMLTAAQAAQALGISPRLIYDLARRGDLPSYRFGSAVRFDPADLTTYKQSCRSAGTPVTSAGAMRSTVSLRVSGTELADCFRKAGVKPRPTPSTARNQPVSLPLRLASSSKTR